MGEVDEAGDRADKRPTEHDLVLHPHHIAFLFRQQPQSWHSRLSNGCTFIEIPVRRSILTDR